MIEDDANIVKAPTYNELYALVTELRGQVTSLCTQLRSSSDVSTKTTNESSVKSEVTEFRVVPDLNKTIVQFTGRESSHQAENWLDDVNGISTANN